MCNASYLYNYIEIFHNSLISFFSLLTTVITVKWMKRERLCWKASGLPSKFKMFIFFFLFCFEGTLQQTKCAATHQRGRKSLKKSIQKYNKIVLFDIPLILVRPCDSRPTDIQSVWLLSLLLNPPSLHNLRVSQRNQTWVHTKSSLSPLWSLTENTVICLSFSGHI